MIPGWQTLPLEGSPALLSFRVMAFLGAVCPADDNSLPLYTLLHVPWWCGILWLVYPLSLPTLAAPVHAWGQKLPHGDQCCQFIFAHGCCWTSWVLNKPLLVLHFVCIWTGWGWDGWGRFCVVFVWLCLFLLLFFLIWSKEAETCLKVFQLPVFLFDITCPSILCQPPKGNRKLSLSVSEATSCLNQKIMENTEFLLSRQGGTGEHYFCFLPASVAFKNKPHT